MLNKKRERDMQKETENLIEKITAFCHDAILYPNEESFGIPTLFI